MDFTKRIFMGLEKNLLNVSTQAHVDKENVDGVCSYHYGWYLLFSLSSKSGTHALFGEKFTQCFESDPCQLGMLKCIEFCTSMGTSGSTLHFNYGGEPLL
ncbi:unnamed protein product [Eruca vesicaria subsp. sativa]|uniref:Uncharacterized protein n=1 Tax=Eruca vesicaria subsp. sativa TaxID=29727 RepID=A0ABC8IV37_ERUVS|nr:unnamed protein product [Eruca vesicaria subsp. sativa]